MPDIRDCLDYDETLGLAICQDIAQADFIYHLLNADARRYYAVHQTRTCID